MIEVIFCIEGIKTVPAELILAFDALHEFAATCSHNANFARWTNFREENLVKITV